MPQPIQGSENNKERDKAPRLHKSEARTGFRRIQLGIGVALLLSSVCGAYLLATDQSLWLLALSHAIGLIVVVLIDGVLGLLSLLGVRRAYLASLAGSFLGIVLQLGDILTAPQYNMQIAHFASYLFGLWAFDLLLALQVAVLAGGLLGRVYAQNLARRRTRQGAQLTYSRRGFLKAVVSLAGLVGVTVALGSVKLPPVAPPTSSQSTASSQSGLPAGAIARVSDLEPNVPLSFEYPQGFPNLLLKKGDGSLVALSALCTHVCCQCYYDSSNNVVYCPCHGSVFDEAGQVLRGPASVPLPSIDLRVDSNGYVYPTGVRGSSPCIGA